MRIVISIFILLSSLALHAQTDSTHTYYNIVGVKEAKGHFVDNVREGDYEYFDKAGHVVQKESYVHGALLYSVYYDTTGKVKSEGGFKNGKFDGRWTFYYEDGTLQKRGNYVDGKLEGVWEFFDMNGYRFSCILYQNDKRIKQVFVAPDNNKPNQ
jgi:antitoxin component YwqK of YwqJK toxin-antitoxin module